MSSEDQEDRNLGEEEEDEEEEREEVEEGEEEGEEGEEGVHEAKPKKRKFEESLPPKKSAMLEFPLALPGKGEDTKTILIKSLPGRKSFEQAYRIPLQKLRKQNILAQLENDPAGKKAFLALDAERQENEDEEEEDDEEDGGAPVLPTPFWLPYVLNNDTFYLDRVLSVMYGYAIPPPSSLDTVASPNEPKEEAVAEEEEEDEDVVDEEDEGEERPKTEKPPPQNFASSSSGTNPPQSSFSLKKPPLTSIPLFAHPSYTFFIAFEKNSEEWHLLDIHPTIWAARYRKSVAERQRQREERLQRQEEEEEEKDKKEDEDEEDDDDDEEEEEEKEEKEEDDEEEEEQELSYNVSTMVKIDALMLAALHSPDALRYILLQPRAPSLKTVEEWLEKDFKKGFFFLSAIHGARAQILQADAPRLEGYSIARLNLDFNYFFQPSYLFSMDPPVFRSPHVMENNATDKNIASFRSVDAVSAMNALLSVNIAPSQRIELKHCSTVEGLLLLLWLVLVMPKSIFVAWSEAASKKQSPSLNEQVEEEDEEEEDEDYDEDGSVSESVLLRRIARDEKRKLKENPLPVKTFFDPAPLFSKLVLEIRRRIKRKMNGKKATKFPLSLCLEQVFKPEHLENGKSDGDPLVASSFSVDAAEKKLQNSPNAALWQDLEAIMAQSVVRHQKLYQSDLALVLLSLTWPQVTKIASAKVMMHSALKDQFNPVTLVVKQRQKTEDSETELKYQSSFFMDLLRAKLNLVASPLRKARSGMFRLLYLVFHRIRSLEIVQTVLAVSPLNQLFGVNERCPLPELIGSWVMDKAESRMQHFEKFINMFWQELYYRVECGLFERDVVRFFDLHCPQVLRLVNQRYTQYSGVISILGGLLHRHSAVHHTTFRKLANLTNLVAGRMEEENYTADEINANPFRDQVLVTVLNPSPYSAEYIREEQRVVAAFESLPMPPRTYYTPETLYRILFCVEQVDLVAVRFLMVVKGISTVRENPFTKEIGALEYAISVQNQVIANLIVGLGFPIDDIMEEGRITLDYFTENKFDVTDTLNIKETLEKNTRAILSDPERQYGILRGVRVKK